MVLPIREARLTAFLDVHHVVGDALHLEVDWWAGLDLDVVAGATASAHAAADVREHHQALRGGDDEMEAPLRVVTGLGDLRPEVPGLAAVGAEAVVGLGLGGGRGRVLGRLCRGEPLPRLEPAAVERAGDRGPVDPGRARGGWLRQRRQVVLHGVRGGLSAAGRDQRGAEQACRSTRGPAGGRHGDHLILARYQTSVNLTRL